MFTGSGDSDVEFGEPLFCLPQQGYKNMQYVRSYSDNMLELFNFDMIF